MDNLFDFMGSLAKADPAEAFSRIKQDGDFSNFVKSQAPYYLQPEGRTHIVYCYDFYFKTGDVISYTVKEFSNSLPVRADGYWDCFSVDKKTWYRYQDGEFTPHDAFLDSRNRKPIASNNG